MRKSAINRANMRSLIRFGVLLTCGLIFGCSLTQSAELTHAKFRKWNSDQLKNQYIQLNVTPQLGGRILGYQLGDHPFLWANPFLQGQTPPPTRLGRDGTWLNWGGDKLWPAPQGWDNDQQWPGPPDAVLDGSPQKVEVLAIHGSSIAVKLTSPKDPKTGIKFSRVIRIFDGSSRVHVVATMTNICDRPIRWGIWTVTQLDAVNKSGNGWNPKFNTYVPINPHSQFPQGYRVLFGKADNPEFQPAAIPHLLRLRYMWIVGKAGLDSPEGWLANVDGTRGYVFVQSFEFEPGLAYPDGSSVEVWTNGVGTIKAWGRIAHLQPNPIENPYIVESELLSPYVRLTPGQQKRFSYDWYSANIGGNYPVLSCSKFGCSCQHLSATRSGQQVLLSGRFGVFYEGRWAIEFVDAHGLIVGEPSLLDRISPLHPLVLNSLAVPAPANAVALRIVIYRPAMERLGELAQTLISQ